MSIALRTAPLAGLRWQRPAPALVVAQRDGEHAGLVEQRAGRFIATDAIGTVIGTFDSERDARAALEPGALERQETQRRLRSNIVMIATGIAALASTGIAVTGMLTLLA